MKRRIANLVLAATLGPSQIAGGQGAPPGVICRVEGYDVALINQGETQVEVGTVVIWSVPFSRSEGRHELEDPLDPGGLVMLNGVLGSSYLRPGTECRILDVEEAP